jgi:hypothetical protein
VRKDRRREWIPGARRHPDGNSKAAIKSAEKKRLQAGEGLS